jgi:hypothetical protein
LEPAISLSDEQRRAHFSELGRRAVESRRARKAAVERVVTAARRAHGLPATIGDTAVLNRVAASIEAGRARASSVSP